MLNLQFLSNKEKLKQQLHEPVVIIKNALVEDVAEKLYQELSESDLWFRSGVSQGKSSKYHEEFSYDRNNIDLHDSAAPETVKALYNYLCSQETMKWFSEVCGRQCDSFRGSATNFSIGDHISEHNDLFIYEDGANPKYKRVLTFNYYLSKGWREDWGGNLVWKKPRKIITPEFNTLVLFNVITNSYHWVDPVIKDTMNKRLSITGWYLQEIKKSKFNLAI